jgi:hypothetical protein
MMDSEARISRASIKPDGETLNWEDKRQGVGLFDTGGEKFWFTRDVRFDANGNDFWVVIKYFGFRQKSAAGTKDGDDRRQFAAAAADAIMRRLIDYYSGDEDKILFPFHQSGSKFLGVVFEDGWILKK